MGYELQAVDLPYGNIQAILWNKKSGAMELFSDLRGMRLAIVESSMLRQSRILRHMTGNTIGQERLPVLFLPRRTRKGNGINHLLSLFVYILVERNNRRVRHTFVIFLLLTWYV